MFKMGSSRTRLLFVILQLVYLISAQEVVKRVPQGFVGMRGKKFTESESAELEHFFKRKPQFFVGVKGKKNLYNSFDPDYFSYKRAPMGFVGMRGKKDFLSQELSYPEEYGYFPKTGGSLIGQIDYSTNEDLRNAQTTVLSELFDTYLQKIQNANDIKFVPKMEEPSTEQMIDDVNKRAANIHQFFGVRGKKSVQIKRPYDLTFRGKFIGVRGKKDVKNTAMQELKVLLDQSQPWPKRKSQMGFFGMRGKKWVEGSESEAEPFN